MLRRIPMIKMELVQNECKLKNDLKRVPCHSTFSVSFAESLSDCAIFTESPHLFPILDVAGNETMTAHQIVLFLNKTNFDIYADHWNEQDLYFGRHHQKVWYLCTLGE
jgi:hypothetical protein